MITARQHTNNCDWVVLELKESGYQTADVVVSKTDDIETAMKQLKHDNRLYNGDTLKENEYEACPYCREESSGLPPDGISYCPSCETIIEGSTIIGTYEDQQC